MDPGLSAREQTLVGWLREARHVLAFCGAGVSAESGVPTFRSSGGLWCGFAVEEVATPEAFARNPQRVWSFYAGRQEQLPTVEPNPAHRVLADMERHYPHYLLVSQNVDDLHERAGSKCLLKIHGNLMETRCTRCGLVAALESPISSAVVERGELPHCPCGGLLRPNVVWFGEFLPPGVLESIHAFFAEAAHCNPGELLLLVLGTSGQVSGGYGLTSLTASLGGRIVEINPEPGWLSAEADLVIEEPVGALLGRVWPLRG